MSPLAGLKIIIRLTQGFATLTQGFYVAGPLGLLPPRSSGHGTTIGELPVFCERFLGNQSSTHWYAKGNNNSSQNPDNMFSGLTVVPLRAPLRGHASPRLKPGVKHG